MHLGSYRWRNTRFIILTTHATCCLGIPNVQERKRNLRNVRDIMKNGNICQERSPLKVVALHVVIDLFYSEINNQQVIQRMTNCFLYDAYGKLVRSVLDGMYPYVKIVSDRVWSSKVGMVSSCQGTKEDLIIFMTGRSPLETQPLGQDSLLYFQDDLYVTATRARFKVIIIVSMKYMHANFPS